MQLIAFAILRYIFPAPPSCWVRKMALPFLKYFIGIFLLFLEPRGRRRH